ncbi:(deoxy)nucleoside triphosphate pyrophosphohydrolase [Pontibacillus marinus]|uniref:8-oxo-dGTP diphosphatase n=1 Tax=Pontibacillus marinus BH030004 = DSM 16465 TaxID=1385511 RepID=A0A0A5GKG2_9BACI|nr:(deoxy)nucleoside triphosphate pyrophosphohydrolase [Pontibacillus marinus]KGX91718.1 NUDIX hydrolase [Pontibacillus marinus BH030004 = DSM 16465]
MKKMVKVVAAIIENENGEILCALRTPEMSSPNRWEFPGGKVEPGEDIHTALEREINEELSCKIATSEVFCENVHEYEKYTIQLIAIKAKLTEGNPKTNEHSKVIWMARENLESLKWVPADVPITEMLLNK